MPYNLDRGKERKGKERFIPRQPLFCMNPYNEECLSRAVQRLKAVCTIFFPLHEYEAGTLSSAYRQNWMSHSLLFLHYKKFSIKSKNLALHSLRTFILYTPSSYVQQASITNYHILYTLSLIHKTSKTSYVTL